jgi:two-component system response regulator AtoC
VKWEVEVMETHDRRALAHDSARAARHAVILNPNSARCLSSRCDSLDALLREAPLFTHVHGMSRQVPVSPTAYVPDVVVVRLSTGDDIQSVIGRCRNVWHRAAILAVVCPGLSGSTERLASAFNGIDDFLSCPFQDPELHFRLKRLVQKVPSAESTDFTGRSMPLVGESPNFIRIAEKLSVLAECRMTVLISGETGTGKELFSRAIHYRSRRSGKPFVPVNCGALPDHLFENELFGHAKGAFTDASTAEKGLVAEAEGGTLFLDEIDALSHAGQVKLLRFLQDGEYRPVGSTRSVHADVRVLAATNTDLRKRVEARLFREDLYYRLTSLSLTLPPLRERIEDVAPLAEQFLRRHASEHGQAMRELSTAALDKLMAYAWPGNIRELESVITRALTFTRSPTLQAEHIEIAVEPASKPSGHSLREAKNSTIATFERRYLATLLAQHQGNVTHAAKAAGKERRSFQRLLRKHNLDRHSFQE